MSRPWSEGELRTLAAVAETFVAGGGERRAELAAAVLVRAADPTQVDQLRLVLRSMESPVVNLALGAGPTPFSAMSPAGRERYLLRWAHSRIGRRRTAYAGLRKLMTFLAYADPGTGAGNPLHADIGYHSERPPTTNDPTPIVPFDLPFEVGGPDEPMRLDADVVVVGSGAGGGVVAAGLATAGRSVVVLEAGPFVDEPSMPTNELDAFDRLYLNHGLLATWDGSVTMLAGSAVGGGTLVNWMTTIAAPAHVRERWRREHGLDAVTDGTAWTDDVEILERELAVRSTTYLPPKDALIMRGAAALGWEAGRTRRDATGCDDCGSCPFGCPRGAKQSGIRAHLATAFLAGARIVPRVRVTRIVMDHGRAVGVEGLALVPDPETGAPIPDPARAGGVRVRPLVVRADQVVIAAGALRTPAILEASGCRHPAIGRHLRIHPVTGIVAWSSTPVEVWRGTMQGARSLEFGEDAPGRHGYVVESAPAHAGLLALAMPWEDRDSHARLMADLRHLAPLIAVTRDGGQGRTTVTRAGRVRIDYRLDEIGRATLRHGLVQMSRLARAGGATRIVVPALRPDRWVAGEATFDAFLDRLTRFDFSPNRGIVLSAHQMGTARMGVDPRRHACDPGGRVRAGSRDDSVVRGLYVADTSLFPTGIGVNPMLTVMALARGVTRTILAES